MQFEIQNSHKKLHRLLKEIPMRLKLSISKGEFISTMMDSYDSKKTFIFNEFNDLIIKPLEEMWFIYRGKTSNCEKIN